MLNFYLKLWTRVKTFGSLPEPGGILDQDERTMWMLDLISEEVSAREERERKYAEAKRDLLNAPSAGGMRIGWHR